MPENPEIPDLVEWAEPLYAKTRSELSEPPPEPEKARLGYVDGVTHLWIPADKCWFVQELVTDVAGVNARTEKLEAALRMAPRCLIAPGCFGGDSEDSRHNQECVKYRTLLQELGMLSKEVT